MGTRRWVPGGVVRSSVLASDGVWAIWYCRQTVWMPVRTYYSSVWLYGKTLPLHPLSLSSMTGLATGKPMLYLPLLKNHTFTATSSPRHYQGPELVQMTELTGVYPRPKQYLKITGRLINQVHIKHWSPGFIVHQTAKHRPRGPLESTWRLFLVRPTKMKIPPSFGVYTFSDKLCCGYIYDTLGHLTMSLDRETDTVLLISRVHSRHWYPALVNIYCIFHQYLHIQAHQDKWSCF